MARKILVFLMCVLSLCEAKSHFLGFSQHTQNYWQVLESLEKSYNIPEGLLKAISLTESGRWDSEKLRSYPWPWTVQYGGKSHYFKTREKALHFAQKLLKKGETNFDLGLMQINYFHHGSKFRNLQEMIHPKRNIQFAAEFLSQLTAQTLSWRQATAFYHSRNAHGHAYQQRVYRHWQDLKALGPTKNQKPTFYDHLVTSPLPKTIPISYESSQVPNPRYGSTGGHNLFSASSPKNK